MKNDGGTAFPLSGDRSSATDHRGLSKRDIFAALIMHAINVGRTDFSGDGEFMARWSYKVADHMIAERGKE
jgi:hypothetical protein